MSEVNKIDELVEKWQKQRLLFRLSILLLAVVIGFAVFMFISNRGLRQDISGLKKENKELNTYNEELHKANKSLKDAISIRDEKIRAGTVIYDSLKTTLENLNNQKIVTINEGIRTVSNLDLDGQIKLLSGFLSEADSISR